VPKLLEFETEDGDGDVIIAARTPEDAVQPVGVRDDAIEKASQSLDSAVAMVRRIADVFGRTLQSADVERAQVEFGLQFVGKGKLYVVESEVQAAMKVTLTFTSSRTRRE
jgi:hypothetical protein